MKTKIAFISALIIFSCAHAQNRPYTESQIKNYSKKIDSIIVSEKVNMNVELDALEKTFKENKFSAEEKQKKKSEVAQKYEDIINQKVDSEKENLEEATRELVKNSVMGKGNAFEIGLIQNNALLTTKSWKTTKKQLLKGDDFNISFGFTNLTKNAGSLAFANKSSEVMFGKSTSLVFEYRATRQLGELTSPVFYRVGLGFRTDNYKLADSKVFVQQNGQISLNDFTAGFLRNSRITNSYITVPVDFVFVLNPKYTTENNEKMLDNSKGNFRVSAGVYGGVKFLSQNLIYYKNFEDHKVAYRENVNGSTNNFLFGGKLSVGYGALNVFVKKDFTAAFNDNAIINNKYGIQIGVELLYISF